jgi:flagellar hook-associated protein 3 FlgL
MAIRVSENMKYNTMVNNLFRVQDSYNVVMEKMASQKKINRPSDDPIGMSRILSLRKSMASVEQYRRNINSCNSWIEITESKLSSVDDLLANAQEIAIAQSTATASAETRSISAATVQQIIDEMLSLANSKYGDRYLFSGTRMDEAPFSSSCTDSSRIGNFVAAEGNAFDGDVTASGTYSGDPYVVRIVTGGSLGEATYEVSDDGGSTWSLPATVPASGTVSLPGGLDLTFHDNGTNHLAAGDTFSLRTVESAEGNAFDGDVTASGTYSGSVNKTYVVKIIDSGAFGVATYQVSNDGGKNWSSTDTIPGDGTIHDLGGDGIDLTFTAGSIDLTANDIFYVNAYAPGYYNGNGEELSVEIGKDTSFDYSISGESVFTDNGGVNVDIFKVLNDLKSSLEANDPDGIAAQLDNLQEASGQVNENIARCGARMNRLEIAENNMADLDFNLTKLISNTEDADISEIATELAMKEIALKASYAMASKIESFTILDFLK